MSAASRRKGAAGELEVAKILQAHGFDARRTPNSGGLSWRGDIAGVPGYVFEVKRTEQIRVPEWLRQAYAAASGGEVPVVVFRRSKSQAGVEGAWHAIVSLEELARLLFVDALGRPEAPASSEDVHVHTFSKILSFRAAENAWEHKAPAFSDTRQGSSHVLAPASSEQDLGTVPLVLESWGDPGRRS